MTGNQPTAATGMLPDGSPGTSIDLEVMVRGCGVEFIRVIDPYDVPEFIALLKEAEQYSRAADGGIAVIIARHPCLMNRDKLQTPGAASPGCISGMYRMPVLHH